LDFSKGKKTKKNKKEGKGKGGIDASK